MDSNSQNGPGSAAEAPMNIEAGQVESVPELAIIDSVRPGPPSSVKSDDDLTWASGKDVAPDADKAVVSVEAAETKPAKRRRDCLAAKDPNSWYFKLSHSTAFGLAVITFAIAADTLVYR